MPETSYQGLSSSDVEKRLKEEGNNEIPQERFTAAKKLIKNLISPITFMLIAASGLSFFTQKIFDGYFILFLLVLNIAITFWQENKADNAIKKLNKRLTVKVQALRNGEWVKTDSINIVKGDIVKLFQGDVVPADGEILEAKNVMVNESSLTGESLPKEKKTGDILYSGAFLTTGLAIIKVSATGAGTYFGKTISSVENVRKKSILEQDIIRVSKFLSVLSIIAIVILTAVFLAQKVPLADILTLDLTLLIAGIPISLPTVMTLIIELGVIELAKKSVIVRRLSSLEDLSNVNYLLTDKTGTLTKNEITVKSVIPYANYSINDVLRYAYFTSVNDNKSTINVAILEGARQRGLGKDNFIIKDFIPVDLERKRSSAVVEKDGKIFSVTVGAPQEIEKLCKLTKAEKEKFEKDVLALAERGYRSVGVSVSHTSSEKEMKAVGLIALSDTLREESKSVLEFLRQNGIDVSMVTGDNRAISAEIVKEVGLDGGKVITKDELEKIGWKSLDKRFFENTGAFAEVLPDDKFRLVKCARQYFVVASNGDGINDLPALKEANVGIAVKNAVDALKSTADIVLLSNGISVIRDALIEARKIFSRIYTYSIYRISESQRLIITIVVLGLLYRVYPLTPLQLILLALLNDIPIISLAFDKVKIITRPAKINVKERFTLSSLYGLTGIANSLLLFFIMTSILHLSWGLIQTIFFLKLTVSGHMLIYVAHTKERWFRFFPSKQVIYSTTLTQILASLIAFTGIFMPSRVPLFWIAVVWIWSFFWMQLAEGMKIFQQNLLKFDKRT